MRLLRGGGLPGICPKMYESEIFEEVTYLWGLGTGA